MELYHNSRDPECRFPLGAVPAGTRLRLRFYTGDNSSRVQMRTWNGKTNFYSMTSLGMGAFETFITVPDEPVILWYDFEIADADKNITRYGNAHDHLGGEGAAYPAHPPSFQITVYDPAFMPPEYLRKGTMYQIFPDRFHRHKPPEMKRPDSHLHEDWNAQPLVDPDPRSGDNRALDFFGGTLNGIREKIPYLVDLGVTVLYLNPIFKARSNHRYDTGDYRAIDPLLGTADDFVALCRAAQESGIRILLDGVFSHTGEDSVYFNRYGHYDSLGAYQSPDSPYHHWYRFSENSKDQYACWWNIPTLPELNKDDPSYRAFILGENGVGRHWVKKGAAGWRLDVADELPIKFIRDLRTAVKKEKSDAVLLGEVWEDASHKVSYGKMRSYCLGDTLDSVMNYPLRDIVLRFLLGTVTAEHVVRQVRSLQENYPVPFFYSLMNLLGSHDRARILNVLCDHEYTSMAMKDRCGMKLPEDARQLAISRLKKMLSIFVALPGMPAIYYGDEAGMEGAADPFCRSPFPWGNIDPGIYDAIKTAFALRKERPVLQTGYLDIAHEGTETLVITRYLTDGRDVFGSKLSDSPYVLRVSRDRFRKQSNR